MSKYTESDFAMAEFARDQHGGKAMRTNPGAFDGMTWFVESSVVRDWRTDAQMCELGFIPVRAEAKPTIPLSDYIRIRDKHTESLTGLWNASSLVDLVNELGIVIIPDLPKTNAERLEDLLSLHDLDAITNEGRAEFARILDADGIVAPEGGDEK